MKNIIKLTLLLFTTSVLSQTEVKMEKEFFTTENLKFALALGGDVSLASDNGKSGMLKLNGNITEDQISFDDSPNTSFSLGFDIYSQQSKLGFFINPTYNIQNFTIREVNAPLRDSISHSNIEIPVYLKLRLGNPLSKSQFWWAVGGGYSIPNKVEQHYIDNTTNTIVAKLEDKDMFKPAAFLSTIIGYELALTFGESEKEVYERDNIKLLFYAKGNYDLGNRINQDYNFGTNTSIGSINQPDLQFLRISFGIKILLRLSKAGQLLNDVTKNIK